MKEQMAKDLTVALNTLSGVYVRGYENCRAMTIGLEHLMNIVDMLNKADVIERKDSDSPGGDVK